MIRAESIEQMWAPAVPMRVLPYEMGGTEEPAFYGMGWVVLDIEGQRYVGHGGEFRTMSSQTLLDPENGVGVSLLYNGRVGCLHQSEQLPRGLQRRTHGPWAAGKPFRPA